MRTDFTLYEYTYIPRDIVTNPSCPSQLTSTTRFELNGV